MRLQNLHDFPGHELVPGRRRGKNILDGSGSSASLKEVSCISSVVIA